MGFGVLLCLAAYTGLGGALSVLPLLFCVITIYPFSTKCSYDPTDRRVQCRVPQDRDRSAPAAYRAAPQQWQSRQSPLASVTELRVSLAEAAFGAGRLARSTAFTLALRRSEARLAFDRGLLAS